MNDSTRATVLDEVRTPVAQRMTVGGRKDPRGTATPRRTARTVGILMLAAYLAYGIGSAIATGIAASAEPGASSAALEAAALSMLLNSAMVIAIGLLMFPILRRHDRAIALGYLFTRIFEGVGLAVGVFGLLSLAGPAAIRTNFLAYNIAEAGLGIGSLFFCFLLFRSRLVPRFLAAWGFVGYASFAAGCLLELAGFTGAGLISVIPGGLFEVTFGIWLIARGFTTGRAVTTSRA
jgi:Domain of unknown function (DUF4386)